MALYIRRMVWVVLIAGCLCGRLAAQSHYVGDKVGTWTLGIQYKLNPQYKHDHYKEAGLTAADWDKFEAKINTLTSLVQNSKTFSERLGFDAVGFSDYYVPQDFPPEVLPGVKVPVAFELEIYLCYYFLADDGYVYRVHGTETPAQAMITVNDLSRAPGQRASVPALTDGRPIWYESREIPLRAGGFQVYEEPAGDFKHFFLTKRDRLPWVPVTREQFVRSLILERERNSLQPRNGPPPPACGDAYKKWMSEKEQRLRQHEESYQELKKILPAQAEKLRATNEKVEAEQPALLLKIQADCLARKKTAMPPVDEEAELIEPLRAELARMTPEERTSQAWYNPLMRGARTSGLVPPNAPSAAALVAVNPDFFDLSRPRTDFQIICVQVASEPDSKLNKDEVPFWRLQEFLTTTDWQLVAELLD